jgi:cytosine/uracil/thiamine/allantoin permease
MPALMRALVACGWFGIQSWIGGEALHTLFTSLYRGWPTLLGAGFGGHTTTEWLSFLLFWGSTSSSSTGAWTCCGWSRTGPRLSCW